MNRTHRGDHMFGHPESFGGEHKNEKALTKDVVIAWSITRSLSKK